MSHRQLALFTEMLDFDESYMDLIWHASDQQATILDAHLIVCVGRRLDRMEPEHLPQNLLYSLAIKRPFDGIVVSHTIYQHMESNKMDEFADIIRPLPVVGTTLELKNIPIVQFDNKPPFRDVVRHVINVHGCKKILIVTGELNVKEAAERYQIWQEELELAGLDHSERMVIEGHFNPIYTPHIDQVVYDRIKETNADAIVVCSDLVAAWLLHRLANRGVHIPQDILMTGCDDIILARFLEPPLTTVLQPVNQQFRTAISLAHALSQGQSFNPAPIAGKMLVRGSCGCSPELWSDDTETDVLTQEAIALKALRHISEGCEMPLSDLRSSLAQAHERSRFLRTRVSELNLFARRIDESDSIESLSAILDEWLPRLGIDNYVISLSCNESGTTIPFPVNKDATDVFMDAPLWHHVIASKPAIGATVGTVFNAEQLVPPEWIANLPRSTFVALPLAINNNWYGIAVMIISAEGNLMCRSVQELTASFIDREFRLREMVSKNLEARIRTQMEAEKMHSMSTLIAGVAHDLATPLGVGRTTTDYMRENFRNLRSAFESNELPRSGLVDFLNDGDSALSILTSSMERAIEQVTSFKRISAEVPREDLRTFKIVSFLRDILKNLQPMWRRRLIQVKLTGPETLEVTTHAAPFLDILTNLVQNSLVHAWPNSSSGTIQITIANDVEKPDFCTLIYADNGSGIPLEYLPRIFEPFFTTREATGGTGLGLHIVQQRVETLLGGTIRCESSPGQGTKFIIEFPRILSN